MNPVWLAGGIFLITYALIVTERVHRTIAALLGGVAIILIGVLEQDQAFHSIDWNVIFLLAGMMMIASILSETGVFQWIAVKSVQLGKGSPYRIMVILVLVTAVTSALLDNVTIVILMAPVTLFIAASLGVSPIPYLIALILASNIGGTATLVGDPPNILIGSAADIDFLTFAANLAPIVLIILIVFMGLARFLFRKDFKDNKSDTSGIEAMDTSELITNRSLLLKSMVVLAGVILGFLFHGVLHLQPATIALAGATVLMLWGRIDIEHVLDEIEWTALFFFIGLFMVVEGLVVVGIIEAVAQAALRLTGGDLQMTSMLLLWLSAIGSGIVDNIPYTATMIPVVENLGKAMPIAPLWWSLALGACLGGNATLVGAAANVVVANLSEKSGHPISFGLFLRYGAIVTFVSIVLASIYVWLRYL
jgi:Na+/H+ antiporter NhaD/arsenite permease-like protein